MKKLCNLLDKCKTMGELKQIHGLMITSSAIRSIILLSRLIDFCTNSESQNLRYARLIFHQLDNPSIYIWNSMIKGYSYSHNPDEALTLYKEMQQRGFSPDHFTFPFALKSCSAIQNKGYGEGIHCRVVKTGFELEMYSSTALLHMYASCADMEAALRMFDFIPKWNVVAWSSLIAGYVNNNQAREAIRVFKDMEVYNVEPNEITLVNVLVACARSRDIETGKRLHQRIRKMGYDPFQHKLDFNIILATSILDMYAKCGSLRTARDVFDKMPSRNLVGWNSIICAYNQYGRATEALGLFLNMRTAGFNPDKATFLSVISSCTKLGALLLGQSFHAYVSKTSVAHDTAIGTTLLDMYAKTGDVKSAQQIFDNLQTKDVMAWTSMIIGLAMHGYGDEALNLFYAMQDDGTVLPDHVTYIGVLSACGHAGLVEEGHRHFSLMKEVHGIVPTIDHYGCMVDLLSRAGLLHEAEKFVERMPMQSSAAIWGALLNGCKIHERAGLADRVKGWLAEWNPHRSGVYVLLSNAYAGVGNWKEVREARDMMKHRRIAKDHGSSSIQV